MPKTWLDQNNVFWGLSVTEKHLETDFKAKELWNKLSSEEWSSDAPEQKMDFDKNFLRIEGTEMASKFKFEESYFLDCELQILCLFFNNLHKLINETEQWAMFMC